MSGAQCNSRIAGIGHEVPPRVVTNDELARIMDTSDEWIQQRTGIRQRHFISQDTAASELGATAAKRALAMAEVEPREIDLVIFCTLSVDVDFPGSASLLSRNLGLRGVPAFDVRNQCSGFLYGLAVADKFIKSGRCRRVLLVGGEIHSTGLDQTTRGRAVSVIFGDGAAAVLLVPEEDRKRGILSTHLHSEGKYAEKLWVEAPTSRCRPRLTEEMIAGEGGRIFPKMEGRYVFKHALRRFPEAIEEALRANALSAQDVDLFILHQANLRISEAVAMQMGLAADRVFNNIDRYGNTTAASIPLALSEAVGKGRVKRGDLVCLAAFGSGFTWASALLRW